MAVKLTLYILTVFLFVNVLCIDPSVHVSFARVFSKKATHNRLKRSVVLSPSAYTEDEKKEMLDAHNEFRRTSDPPAADMNLLTWNDQLADSAQSWAEQCIWDHGQVEFDNQQYDPMGQNLWRGGNKVSVSAVNAWHNEYKYYNYTENSCQEDKVCGHYTQVLWGDTKQVGCGFYSCPDGGTIVACNYGPAGNYNRQPYIEGSRCSMCANPGYCYDGTLCSTECYDQSIVTGTCECSYQCQNCGVLNETDCTCSCKDGWHGDQCEAVCADTSQYCNAGWYKAQCSGYSYVRDGCPAMCGICVEPTDATADECPCGGKMCKNGGQLNTATCTCSCPNAYTGDLCDTMVVLTAATTEAPVPVTTDPTICGGKTCQNNRALTVATCTCECINGFTGHNCENVVTTAAAAIKTEIETMIEMTTVIAHPITTQMEVRTEQETRPTTDKLSTTTDKPATTNKSRATTEKSRTTTDKPTTTEKSKATTDKSRTTTDKPRATTNRPTTTDKPTTYKTETDANTPIPPVCQLQCPKGFVLDHKLCACIENIYGKCDKLGNRKASHHRYCRRRTEPGEHQWQHERRIGVDHRHKETPERRHQNHGNSNQNPSNSKSGGDRNGGKNHEHNRHGHNHEESTDNRRHFGRDHNPGGERSSNREHRPGNNQGSGTLGGDHIPGGDRGSNNLDHTKPRNN